MYELDPRVVQVTNTCYRAGQAGKVIYLGVGIGYPYPERDHSPRAGWWLAVTDTTVVGEYQRLPEALAALLGQPQTPPVEQAAQAWPDDPAQAARLLELGNRRGRAPAGPAGRDVVGRWLNLPTTGPLAVLALLLALAALAVLLTTGLGPTAGLLAAAASTAGLSWLPACRRHRAR